SLWRLVRPHLFVFDPVLTIALAMLIALSFVTMHSAALDYDGRMQDHARNVFLAFAVMWLAANAPLRWMQRISLPTYLVGIALLVAVALFGDVAKGARRWLDLGVTRIQPSELMKIAT